MIRIIIAEDHQSLIDGLELKLQQESDIQVVGTAIDGEELLEEVKKKSPDLVVTDIRMPKMDGISAARQITKQFPHVKIVCFTMFGQDEAVQQMFEAGASGYILKNSSLQDVLKGIRSVWKGETYFDENINAETTLAVNSNAKKGVLTRRQKEILSLIAEGKTTLEIADQLFIGVHTVRTHRKNMTRILGLRGSGELLRYAMEKKYDF